MARKTEDTSAPDKRDGSTDETVTELATVDADTSLADMREMSCATDKDASDQQRDALEGMKKARDDAKHPESKDEPQPFAQGPGGMVA